MAVGWGGGFVVVEGRESRPRGEGSQQVGSEDAGRPGGRRSVRLDLRYVENWSLALESSAVVGRTEIPIVVDDGVATLPNSYRRTSAQMCRLLSRHRLRADESSRAVRRLQSNRMKRCLRDIGLRRCAVVARDGLHQQLARVEGLGVSGR
jgi:hypothetical protein